MAKKEWTKDEVMELIYSYEENEILWNSKHEDYRSRDKKSEVYEDLAQKFQCTVAEVQRKLHNLRNQVSQELAKIRKRKSRNVPEDNCTSTWPYFSALKFLIPALTTSFSALSYVPEVQLGADNETESLSAAVACEQIKKTSAKKVVQVKRKIEDHEEGLPVKNALCLLKKEPDEYDSFGEYVAMELRSLRSELSRRKLKTEIRKAIFLVADEDDQLEIEPSTSATPVTSNTCRLVLASFKPLHQD